MNVLNDKPKLSESLEDYLESIYTLVRDRKVARVKEIVANIPLSVCLSVYPLL